MNPREKYYIWILNNPKWLKIPKTAYIRLKDDIINDISICNDLIKLYPEISNEEPEELLQSNPLRFFLFVRAFMVDIRWKIKYERYSIINNNKKNEESNL